MIPKVIHYCWLSGDPYPKVIERCMATWKVHLPDYEFVLWDTHRFNLEQSLWVKQAYETRKYAFAADYIRLYALYNYGGIYLDSDVEVFKSFNDLLDLPYFVGEDMVHCFEAAVLGAEKETPWIKKVLNRFENRAFIMDNGEYDTKTCPAVFRDELRNAYQFKLITKRETYPKDDGVIRLFSKDFFNSRDYVGPKRYPNSYSSHCFAGTWYEHSGHWYDTVKQMLPRSIQNVIYWCCYQTGPDLRKGVLKYVTDNKTK